MQDSFRQSCSLQWPTAALMVVAATASGCGPMWYGSPPPTYPPGQGMPPEQFQQPTMVPSNPPPLQVPGSTPPSTFQGGSSSGSLNDVPEAAAGQVLMVPNPKSTSTYHDVQQGETLSSIAKKFGVTIEALKEANVFDSNFALQPGQVILIP